jgi:hypothetical protein
MMAPGELMKLSVHNSERFSGTGRSPNGFHPQHITTTTALQLMFVHHHSNPVVSLIGKLLFPKSPRYLRRRDTWFLIVSLALGSGFCLAFAWVLFTLNHQGRL